MTVSLFLKLKIGLYMYAMLGRPIERQRRKPKYYIMGLELELKLIFTSCDIFCQRN